MKKITLALSVLFCSSAFSQALPVEFAGCKEADFVSSPDAAPKVSTRGTTYTPKCLKVKAGTAITIVGADFHPLQGVKNLSMQPENPFFVNSDRGNTTEQTHTLNALGVYGHYCLNHGASDGSGMAGAIWVVSQ